MATTKKKPTKKASKSTDKVTHVAIVLDRSGSMSSYRKAAVDGINEQFATFRKHGKKGGKTEISLIQFDDQIDLELDGVKSDELIEWAYEKFQPRGSTALNDAIWRGINHLKSKPKAKNTSYLLCVISDGQENASREVSEQQVAAEIARLNETREWTFTYMLGGRTNEEVQAIARVYNVPTSNALTFNLSNSSYCVANSVTNTATARFLDQRAEGLRSVGTMYTADEQTLTSTTK